MGSSGNEWSSQLVVLQQVVSYLPGVVLHLPSWISGYPGFQVGPGGDWSKGEADMKRNPSAAELKEAARVFKALSHPDRLRLTCLLAERPYATQHELVEELGWPQSTVARHLGTLRERGLITGSRQGAEVLLEAAAMPRFLLDTVCTWMEPGTGMATAGASGDGMDESRTVRGAQ